MVDDPRGALKAIVYGLLILFVCWVVIACVEALPVVHVVVQPH